MLARSYNLRISLTDACAFRCPYCLPDGPGALTPRQELLTAPELHRLVSLLTELGVDRVRLTGGEPLQRADCLKLVEALRLVPGIREIALTTNGEHLAAKADALAAAGVDRINVHLDSLRPDRFRALARRSTLKDVLAAIERAREAGLNPVRINTVVMAGINDDELEDFCEFALSSGLSVRFIEMMNTGSAQDFFRRHFISAAVLRDRIARRYRLRALDAERGSAPALEYELEGRGRIGFIASETEPFCARCDRLRLTADGRLSRCLYESGGVPLKGLLRSGALDEILRETLARAIGEKRSHHPEFGATGAVPFSMSQIGG